MLILYVFLAEMLLLSDRVDHSSACNSSELLIIRVQELKLQTSMLLTTVAVLVLKIRPALLPRGGCMRRPNLAVVFSERELAPTFAICYRPSVCRLSVMLVHPTRAVEIFRNISTAFDTLAIR